MSHSRKDARGGHRRTWLNISDYGGGVVSGESGKRYAKRFRSKLARRHGRLSLRDLEIIEPEDVYDPYEDLYDEHDGLWNYIEPDDYYDPRDYDYEDDDDPYDYAYDDYYSYDDYRLDDDYRFEDRYVPPEPIHQYLRNVGNHYEDCWVPCARGDPGAVRFIPEEEL
jgi:hypothetical protein